MEEPIQKNNSALLLITENCQIEELQPKLPEHKKTSKLMVFCLFVMFSGSLFLFINQKYQKTEPLERLQTAIQKTINASSFRIEPYITISSDLPQTEIVSQILKDLNDQNIAINPEGRIHGDFTLDGDWNIKKPLDEEKLKWITTGENKISWNVNQKEIQPWKIEFRSDTNEIGFLTEKFFPIKYFPSIDNTLWENKWWIFDRKKLATNPIYGEKMYNLHLLRDEDRTVPGFLTDDQIDHIKSAFIEKIPDIATNLSKEADIKSNEEVITPFTFDINNTELLDFISRINEIAPVFVTIQDLVKIKHALAGLQAVHGEIWIDQQEYIRKIDIKGQYDWQLAKQINEPNQQIPAEFKDIRTTGEISIDLSRFEFTFPMSDLPSRTSGITLINQLGQAYDKWKAENTKFINDENIIIDSSDQLARDKDQDGLSNFEEINKYHTDPNNPDTDGDGYLDGEEVFGGFNPLGEG